nr:hypothetical protein [Tanacetum cinerariifolium]
MAKTINEEAQLHARVDGKKIMITEASIRRDLQLANKEGLDCLPNSTIFEQLALMGYEKVSQKLTFYKPIFSTQWKFLIHTILQYLSPKTTAWNEFSKTVASAIIYLATNQKFNFFKMDFDSMIRNLDNVSGKFLMYPRPAGHRPHGPSMNPIRLTMNGARPYKSFFQAPSYETRPFLKSSAIKNPYRAPWVPTVNSMRADKFWKRTGKKISIQGSDVAGFDKSKVECFNCHKMGHFAKECRAPKSQERGRKESYRQGSKAEEKSSKALMAIDGVGWDWSYMVNEEDHALVADGEAPTEFALMANIENKVFDNSLCLNECKKNADSLNSKIKDLKSELSEANNFIYHYKLAVAQLEGRLTEYKEKEEVKLEKDGLDRKLAGLLKALKNLDHLIESQRSDQVKEEVGYNVVPPPAADLYLSPKKDLSWTGLPEFVADTVTDYSRPSPTVVSTSAEGGYVCSLPSTVLFGGGESPFTITSQEHNPSLGIIVRSSSFKA